jgi:uncharacterized protein YfkK (UPF0435 family)
MLSDEIKNYIDKRITDLFDSHYMDLKIENAIKKRKQITPEELQLIVSDLEKRIGEILLP